MKLKIRVTALSLASLFLFSACSPVPKVPEKIQPRPTQPPSKDQKVNTNAKLAEVLVAAAPYTKAVNEGSDLEVPAVDVTLTNADYVKVLRCKQGKKFLTDTGNDAKNIASDPKGKEDELRWVWSSATRHGSGCEFVGTQLAGSTILDYAANSGAYFYIVNPCIFDKNLVNSGSENGPSTNCSHRLQFSEDIVYTSKFNEAVIKKLGELAAAESALTGSFMRLQSLAKNSQQHLDQCDEAYREDLARQSFFKGLISIIGGVIGGVVGGLVTGGVGAMKGFKTGMGLGMALAGRSPDLKFECHEYDDYITTIQQVIGETDAKIQGALKLREELYDLNKEFAKIDKKILEGYLNQTE